VKIKSIFLSGLILLAVSVAGGQVNEQLQPYGPAVDLWGTKINLSDFQDDQVFIYTFTPSNCGYCLFEGDFVGDNYCRVAGEQGGNFFGLCVFNPQLDIYAFQKHFREEYPVLTAPVSLLSRYHGGYPGITAIADGRIIYIGSLTPYEGRFDSLMTAFWPDEHICLYPTGPRHTGTRFLWENNANQGVTVCPDGDWDCIKRHEASQAERRERFQQNDRVYHRSYSAIFESDLKPTDYQKTLLYKGWINQFTFAGFKGFTTPICITESQILIGEFAFNKDNIGFSVVMPNPHNRSRYIILHLRGKAASGRGAPNWLDYYFYQTDSTGKTQPLLCGYFEKNDTVWQYSRELAKGTEAAQKYCREGVCPAPAIPEARVKFADEQKPPLSKPLVQQMEFGRLWTLGTSSCRLPSVMVDGKGVCRVAWEEQGDILLAQIDDTKIAEVINVDAGPSDSYNPVLAGDGNAVWIFYLDDRTRFYRLYARSYDGRAVSPAVMISANELLDAITPAVAYNNNGAMAVSWSNWKANQRYLMWREIINRVPGEIREAVTKTNADGYTNAWYSSMVMSDDGRTLTAWNQHYPVTLGVYAGDLMHVAQAVIAAAGNGGYPSLVFDAAGKLWAAWESFPWDFWLEDKPQSIQAARFDDKEQTWSLPYTVSEDTISLWNQTPQLAATDDGRLWVVWSGRFEGTKPWQLYISHFENEVWSAPMPISEPETEARAPRMCSGLNNDLWIGWHSGVGAEMKIKVLNYQPR
jgi:hypothetical protein